MSLEVGFVGIGGMGLPMAANLMTAGMKLRVFNRSAEKTRPLAERGATIVGSVGDTALPGAIVATIVSDDAAVEELVVGDNGLAARLAPGGIHLSMSTISPAAARRLAQYHRERGSAYVAAPVFGRPDAAAARQLVICVSGEPADKERVRPLLDAMGRAVYDYGSDAGAAHTAKLTGNFLIGAAIEALGEALAMAEKNGVDRVKVAEMLGETLFACRIYQGYGKLVAHKQHNAVGFRMALGLKDTELILRTAGDARVPMPIANLVRDRTLAALAKGRGELDWAAISLEASEAAGLK